MAFLTTFVSVVLLGSLCAFGVYSMRSLSLRNGYSLAVQNLENNEPRLLPGSKIPLLQEYTGIKSIDQQLTVFQCVFAHVTDGSSPPLSLFSFYFVGQLVPALAVFLAESYRSRQSVLFKFPLLWFAGMQLVGFGILAPIYAILHLLFAPLNSAVLSPKALGYQRLIINSIWAGFVAISTVLTLAQRETYPVLYQRLMALWQFFPLILSLAQFFFGLLSSSRPMGDDSKLSHQMLEATYLFALRFCLSSLAFSDVFSPPNPFPPSGLGGPTPQITSMAAGFHGFLMWDMYVGIASMVVWSCTVMTRAKRPGNQGGWLRDLSAVLMLTAVGGPGGVLVGAMMYRDWMLLEDSKEKKRME